MLRIKWSEYCYEFYTHWIIGILQISASMAERCAANWKFSVSFVYSLNFILYHQFGVVKRSQVERCSMLQILQYIFFSPGSIIWWNIWNQMYAWYVRAIAIYQKAYKLTWYGYSSNDSKQYNNYTMRTRENKSKRERKNEIKKDINK